MDDTKYIELTKEQAHEDFKRRFGIIDDNVEPRDKFAMAALNGICAVPGVMIDSIIKVKLAKWIWEMADAMLEARDK